MDEQIEISKEEALSRYYEDVVKLRKYFTAKKYINLFGYGICIMLQIGCMMLLFCDKITYLMFFVSIVAVGLITGCVMELLLYISKRRVTESLLTKNVGHNNPDDIESYIYGNWLIMNNPKFFTRVTVDCVVCTDDVKDDFVRYVIGNGDITIGVESQEEWLALKYANNIPFLMFDLNKIGEGREAILSKISK